jgi:hypothetical protein
VTEGLGEPGRLLSSLASSVRQFVDEIALAQRHDLGDQMRTAWVTLLIVKLLAAGRGAATVGDHRSVVIQDDSMIDFVVTAREELLHPR